MSQQHSGASVSASSSRTGLRWGIGGAVLASLCCLSPVVAVLLGLGGASFLFALPQYRIPLLLAGLGFSAVGVWMALRQSRQTCTLAQHRRNQWLFPATMLGVFVVGYGILTYGIPTLVYNSLGPSAASAAPADIPAAPKDNLTQPEPLPQTDGPASSKAVAPQTADPVRSAPKKTPAAENPAPATGPHRASLTISGMT